MRLIACLLSLGLLSAGCAIQTGDPTAEETQRPDEVVVAPDTEGTTRSALPAKSTPDLAGSASAQESRTNGHGSNVVTPAATPAPTGGPPTGDNPNPSPWAIAAPGTVFAAPAPKGNGS